MRYSSHQGTQALLGGVRREKPPLHPPFWPRSGSALAAFPAWPRGACEVACHVDARQLHRRLRSEHTEGSQIGKKTTALERANGFPSRFRYSHALKGFAPGCRRVGSTQPSRIIPSRHDPAQDRVVHALDALAPGEPPAPTGIRRIEAATATTARPAERVNVAVIDTGIDLTHPDEAGKNCVTTGATAPEDPGPAERMSQVYRSGETTDPESSAWRRTRSCLGGQGAERAGRWNDLAGRMRHRWVTATRSDADPANDIAVANMSLGGTSLPADRNLLERVRHPEYAAPVRFRPGRGQLRRGSRPSWVFDCAASGRTCPPGTRRR